MMIRLGILILCVSGCLASNSAGSLGQVPGPSPRRLGPGIGNQVPFNPIYIPVAETPVSQSIEPFIGPLNLHRNRGNAPRNLMQLPNGPNVPFPGGLQRIHPATGGTQATGVPVINFNDFISLIRQGTVTHSGSGPFGAGRDLTYVNLGSLIPNAPEVAIPSNFFTTVSQRKFWYSCLSTKVRILFVEGNQSAQAQIPSLSQTPSLGSLSSALSNINRTPGVPASSNCCPSPSSCSVKACYTTAWCTTASSSYIW
nr:uncharacterized protein LOC105324774 isoform X2 [Crassostrea gigas]